ncbi:MAG: hypothetical protein NVS3B20_04680 [Polyangiales bacterium]
MWLLSPNPGRLRAVPIGVGGTLGRSEDSTLRIDAPGVAPIHARVDLVERAPGSPPEIYVTDAGAPSGTYVSGMRAQRTVLHDGDLLRIGSAIALVVERDIGTYDGAVVEDGGMVRAARSRRGWFASVELAMAVPKEVRRGVIVAGPKGSGRRSVVRRICDAWGVRSPSAGAPMGCSFPAEGDILGEESLVAEAITKAAVHGGVVLRGLDRLPAARHASLTRLLQALAKPIAMFAVVDDVHAVIAPEVAQIFSEQVVTIPSIEQRREEIPSIVRGRFDLLGVAANRLSIELYEALTRAAWPGEIEEIVETVERVAKGNPDVPRLGPEHLIKPLARRGGRVVVQAKLTDNLSEADRIRAALAEAKGSVAAAARALHLSRQALYREATRLGIDIRRARETGSAA